MPKALITNLPASTIAAGIVSKFFGAPVYYLFHGSLKIEKRSFHSYLHHSNYVKTKIRASTALLHQLQTLGIFLATKTVVFSQYSQALFLDQFKTKSVLVYPPVFVDTRKKTYPKLYDHSVTNILISNRIEPRKGTHLVIQAAQKLQKKKKILFHFMGPPFHREYFNQLFDQTQNDKLQTTVKWYGYVPHDEIIQSMNQMDIFIMPSITGETLGFSTLEALLKGKVVIGSDTGATPEILSHISKDLIFRANNSSQLAAKIAQVVKMSKSQRSQLRKSAIKFVKSRYSPEKFRIVFNDLIKGS